MVFLAILYALRPDLVDLSKARTRSNKQNLEEAFRVAERELGIPRLLDPNGGFQVCTMTHHKTRVGALVFSFIFTHMM